MVTSTNKIKILEGIKQCIRDTGFDDGKSVLGDQYYNINLDKTAEVIYDYIISVSAAHCGLSTDK